MGQTADAAEKLESYFERLPCQALNAIDRSEFPKPTVVESCNTLDYKFPFARHKFIGQSFRFMEI